MARKTNEDVIKVMEVDPEVATPEIAIVSTDTPDITNVSPKRPAGLGTPLNTITLDDGSTLEQY